MNRLAREKSPDLLQHKEMGVGGGRAAAYVCSGGACLLHVSSAAELLDSLS